ncbi:DUF2971 domain-containing protein [Xanthomonas arboricola pv. corylina]|nr:DUF2971 domain-containing protein [Xanthomonas arboricola pv. corylina]
MFDTKELYLASPASWDDPYERILKHQRSDRFFAQCWCKKSVSDAMWRIYSQDRTGIRIRTTKQKLFKSLRSFKEIREIGWLVKDVRYASARKINKEISKIADELRVNYTARRAADALLIKRDAFDHESEVRIVVDDRRADNTLVLDSLRVPVDPHDLIENVFFDPRVDPTFERVCTHFLKTKLKYRGNIGRSSLYKDRDSLVVE